MSYGQYQQNPYQQGPSAEQGYGQDQQQYEMQNYGAQAAPGPATMTSEDFFKNIEDVRRNMLAPLEDNVNAISSLHQRALADADNGLSAQQLERLVSETQLLNTRIRDQLKFLFTDALRTEGSAKSIKKRQVENLQKNFEGQLRNYQQKEASYRQSYREQIARQFRIVNPDATESEVQQATDADWGNEGVFQTALRTNRQGQASAVLGNVRQRHTELQRIEQTLYELSGMFRDLDMLVAQQDETIQHTEQSAEQTKDNLDQGNVEVHKGIHHAKLARKWKWWCLLICIIIIAIAVGVGVGVYKSNEAARNAATGGGGNGA